jgi:hypothetical protein
MDAMAGRSIPSQLVGCSFYAAWLFSTQAM